MTQEEASEKAAILLNGIQHGVCWFDLLEEAAVKIALANYYLLMSRVEEKQQA